VPSVEQGAGHALLLAGGGGIVFTWVSLRAAVALVTVRA
jgi:hypothetical protein